MSSTSGLPLSSRPVFTTTISQGQDTTATSKAHGRSSSFTSALKRLLPSNRSERGGTLRSNHGHRPGSLDYSLVPASNSVPSAACLSAQKLVRRNAASALVLRPSGYMNNPSPSLQSQQLYLERRERRRRRRTLKESGDYLGVQGINPRTGEMDVVTPSTSTASSPFFSLARAVQDKRLAYENARKALHSEKLRKWEMDKAALKAERRRKVRWTQRGEQWSSALEPNLSPIHGSTGVSTPREAEMSTETVIRASSERSQGKTETEDDSISTMRPATKVTATPAPAGHVAPAGHGIWRKPVPIRSHILSSRRSHSDLIAIDSELPRPPTTSPEFGLKQIGYHQPGQSNKAFSAALIPSGSFFGADTLHARVDPHTGGLSTSGKWDTSQGRQSDDTGSSTSRQRSASSALDFRPRSTPDSYLNLPPPSSNTRRGWPILQRACPWPSPPPKRPDRPRSGSPCIRKSMSRGSSLDDTATFRGKSYRSSREIAEGKMCLHTHHHHYWIMSDPARMQQVIPKLRSSKKRVGMQRTDENSKIYGTMSSWPSEDRVEALAESQRAPSRNTNQRYLVKGS